MGPTRYLGKTAARRDRPVGVALVLSGGQNDDRAKSRGTKRLVRRTHPRGSGRHFGYSFTQSGLTTALRYFSSR